MSFLEAFTPRNAALIMEETESGMACRFAFRSKIGPLIINMLHGSFLRELARMMRAADGCDREVRTTEELARRMRAGRAPQAKDLGVPT